METRARTAETWPRDEHGCPVLESSNDAILYGRLAAGDLFRTEQLRDMIYYHRAVALRESAPGTRDLQAAHNAAVQAQFFNEAWQESIKTEGEKKP